MTKIFTLDKEFHRRQQTFGPNDFIFSYLRDSITNSIEMNVNGAVTPRVFRYVVPPGFDCWLKRINITALAANINPDNFFGVPLLTQGMTFIIREPDGTLELDFTNGHPMKQLADFGAFSGSDAANIIDKSGPANDFAAIRWTFAEAGKEIFLKQGINLKCFLMIIYPLLYN